MLELLGKTDENHGREVVGSLCRGESPRISGPLVGQSCLTAQTAACGGLRALPFAGIGGFDPGPAWQGHDCLQAANCRCAKLGRTQEINHDQNQTHECLIHKRAGRFLPSPKTADFPRILPSNSRALANRSETVSIPFHGRRMTSLVASGSAPRGKGEGCLQPITAVGENL